MIYNIHKYIFYKVHYKEVQIKWLNGTEFALRVRDVGFSLPIVYTFYLFFTFYFLFIIIFNYYLFFIILFGTMND